jgi:hypothetical protein
MAFFIAPGSTDEPWPAVTNVQLFRLLISAGAPLVYFVAGIVTMLPQQVHGNIAGRAP